VPGDQEGLPYCCASFYLPYFNASASAPPNHHHVSLRSTSDMPTRRRVRCWSNPMHDHPSTNPPPLTRPNKPRVGTRFSALLFHPLSGENIAIGWLGRGENDRTNDIRWRSRPYIMSERPLDVSAFEIEGDRDGVQESCVRLRIHSTTRHGRCIQFTGRSARLHSRIQSKHEMIGSIHIYQQMDRQSSPTSPGKGTRPG